MSIEEDCEIVALVLAGDKAAFGTMIEQHRASALALFRRILDANETEDAVQEAFLAAFLGLKALRDADWFRGWILGIVAIVCEFRCHSTKLREAGVSPVMTADAASESGALPFDGFF